jgi:hypothetical protein
MRIVIVLLLCVLGLGMVQAQTQPEPPKQSTMRLRDFLNWAKKVQLEHPTLPTTTQPARLLMFQAGLSNPNLMQLVDDLAHGYVDCTGTFLCINAPNYHPQRVEVLTGAALEASYSTPTNCRWVGFSWSIAHVCATLYIHNDAPKQSLWMWQTAKKDYLVTGAGLEPNASLDTTVSVVEGVGFLQAMQQNMMIDRVLASARRVGVGVGTQPPAFFERRYATMQDLVSRVMTANDVTIIGKTGAAFATAIKNARAFYWRSPIRVIAHESQYPNMGACFANAFGTPLHYYLFKKQQPAGAMVVIRDAQNEIIQGSLLTEEGVAPTVGFYGSEIVDHVITQLNLGKLIDQTYSPSETLFGIFTLPCR